MGVGPWVAGALALLGMIHVYWALGGRIGADAAVPERPGSAHAISGHLLFTPSRGATLLVAAALLAAALVVLGCAGAVALPLPHWALRAGVALLAGLMFLRAIGDGCWVGLLKRVRGTRFAYLDTWLFVPLCLLLGVGLVLVARG